MYPRVPMNAARLRFFLTGDNAEEIVGARHRQGGDRQELSGT
jgi:hypothetical protein